MKNRQKWIFEKFQVDLSRLKPKVRAKALDIAEQLMDKKGYSDEEALEIAIKRAEEWFLDLNG